MSIFSKIWNKYLGGKKKSWADIAIVDGKMQVKAYNDEFLSKLKIKLGDGICDGKSNEEIVKLFYDRENITLEEPKLEVIHSGIMEDGRIRMELDWNSAFIKQLSDNGIVAETEDEAVQLYLSLLTHQHGDDITQSMLSKEDVDSAFRDLDLETEAELAEAARQVEEQAKLIKKQKVAIRKKKSKVE